MIMRQRTASGTYDTLHPQTVGEQVLLNSGENLEDVIADRDSYKMIRSNKDSEGTFTTVEFRRKSDNTLAARFVLSGGISPQYTTRTVTQYAANGTTVIWSDSYTISYDADGDWTAIV